MKFKFLEHGVIAQIEVNGVLHGEFGRNVAEASEKIEKYINANK